ncbi:hypothetical protein O181_125510 [Austropuccinia psidii MF-1]|uniref:Uncharacterized protein n=1 Tax=Austropuccinia psidii MF-1 TaxID=1389203 RepID=A0A9Q3KPT5_9BASI|nr:hypothetical protein [Austropuccinia psidii MF-1]
MAKNGSYGFYGHFGVQRVFGQILVQGIDVQNWLRWAQLWFGTHLALGARWLPALAPFGRNELGQKGPNTPMDCGPLTMNYGPWAIEAVGGLNGPKPKMMARGARTPWKTKGPLGPKSKIKAWGLVRWKLAKEPNDGRIWPEAIKG